jgi:hypothetical protein
MPASLGVAARLAFGGALPVDQPLEFMSESLRARKTILETAGLRGTRSRPAARTRAGTYRVSGNIRCAPAPSELAALLPYVLGGTPQPNTPPGFTTFPLGETLPAALYVAVDRVAAVFTYDRCRIVRATFRAAEGSLLELELEIEGRAEEVSAAGSFPQLAYTVEPPFVFMDAELTVQGAARAIKQVEVNVENLADSDRFLNDLVREEIPVLDRLVSLRALLPYTPAETALYDQPLSAGPAELVFTNGAHVLRFRFPGVVQFPAVSPVVKGRGEILLELSGVARATAAEPELRIELASAG